MSRFESSQPSKKRGYYGHKRNLPDNSEKQSKEKRNLRRESEELLSSNPGVKFAFRDIQANLTPTKYIPQTGDTELNKRIEDRVNRWMKVADYYGRRHLLGILSLGPARQMIAGEHGLALIEVEGSNDFKVQSIPAERIGGDGYTPADTLVRGTAQNWENRIKKLTEAGRYCDGREFDINGRLTHYWIFKRKKKDGFGTNSSGWEYDRRLQASSVFIWDDPLHPDEIRGVPELAQALNDTKDQVESMEAMKTKIKAVARKFLTYKSDLGDLPDNFMDQGAKGCGCESDCDCAKPQFQEYNLPDGGIIDALSNEFEAKLWDNDLPGGSFESFMECLRVSPAMALHLPASQLGVKGGKIQGTDVRMDNEKAQAEYKRKRDEFIRQVYQPLIEAQLAKWHDAGEFEGVDFSVLIKGRWGFCKSPNADEGRSMNALALSARMGWTNDDEVADKLGLSEEQMREGRKAQALTLVTDAMEISKATGAKFEAVIRLLKDQSLGTVPESHDEPQQPDPS